MGHMFEVATEANTARVNMNNPITGISETWDTATDPRAIAYAVMCFARKHGLYPFMVETAIQYPAQTAPSATPPSTVPPIGSTIHIRTMGKRKPAVPHTIEGYIQGTDGAWSYKARDYAGWVHIDSVDTLTP